MLGRYVNHLLDAVHIGGKGGEDDTFLTALEKALETGPYRAFRTGEAGAFHVGGGCQQGQDPLLPQFSQTGQIHDLALDGGGVDLKVPRVDNGAHRRLDGEAHRIRNGVVHVDELHRETPRLDHIPCLTGDQLGAIQQAVFLQL